MFSKKKTTEDLALNEEGPIEDRLRSCIHERAPLGPCDAADITDPEVAARLFDPHNKSYNSLLRRDLSVVIGRRGSGKTALVTSYKYRPYLDNYHGSLATSRSADVSGYEVVIEVSTHKKFEELQRRVVKDDAIFRPIESVVDDWAKVITDYFVASLLSNVKTDNNYSDDVALMHQYLIQDDSEYEERVRKEIWGEPLWAGIKALGRGNKGFTAQHISQDQVMKTATSYLRHEKKEAVILFDSMDEYPIGNKTFDRTIGALVRFISRFNNRYTGVRIKLVLPSEIFPEVQRASGNPLKDMVSFDQVHWSPLELMRMAAHRYKIFLSLYDPEWDELQHLDLSRRDDVHRFWARLLPKTQVNRYGAEEETVIYILRHTHLLPRQLLRILEKIIMQSHDKTGGYRKLNSDSVRKAIEQMELVIAGEIFKAFERVYPHADRFGRALFGNFPTVFSFDQFETQWRRHVRKYMHSLAVDIEMVEFADMFIRMGIVGLIVPEKETERYYQGKFGYGVPVPFNIGSGHELCLHPIFSKTFNASGNLKSKAILPQDITLDDDD
ncbi:MAG: hypothetical protein WAQ99_09285 [Pyrinomonadaceae bacterium]